MNDEKRLNLLEHFGDEECAICTHPKHLHYTLVNETYNADLFIAGRGCLLACECEGFRK